MANTLNKVNSGGIEDGSIVNADIKSDAAIAKSKLAALDLVNADINASAAIAGSKLADNAVGLAQMAGGTDGNLITYDTNGDPAHVTTGTSGQILTSNGTGAAPTFQAAPTSGAALTGSTDNTVVTVTGANAIQGEANLKFDGTELTLAANRSNTAGTGHISIAPGDTTSIWTIRHDQSGNDLWFDRGTDASSTAYIGFSADGNIKLTSGKGIDFSATADTSATGASATSELLDDYEEGTWTPYFQSSTDISGVTGYGLQVGRYVKIGRMVFCTFEMYGNSGSGLSSGSNDLWVKGRPFDMHSGAPNARGCCYLGGITNDTTYYMYFLTTEYYGDNGYIYGKNSGSNHGVAMGSTLTDTSSCSGWFVYNAA